MARLNADIYINACHSDRAITTFVPHMSSFVHSLMSYICLDTNVKQLSLTVSVNILLYYASTQQARIDTFLTSAAYICIFDETAA